MRSNQKLIGLFVLVGMGLSLPTTSVELVARAGDTAPGSDEAWGIAQRIKSGNEEALQQACQQIRQAFKSDPQTATPALRNVWIGALMDTKRYDTIAELTDEAVVTRPDQTADVEYFLQFRIRMLLKLGRAKDALVTAKRLFNVASMPGTKQALLLCEECLKAAYPNNPAIVAQFRREQIDGAKENSDANAPSFICQVLQDVSLKDTTYEKRFDYFNANDFYAMLARGNLMLMTGRAEEASAVFAVMPILDDEKSREIELSVARAIKAEDGTIGRANKHLRMKNNEP